MGKPGIILMLTTLAAWLPAAGAGLSPLQAISMLESGNNDAAVGPAGEVSRYQILPRVWRQWSQSGAYADSSVASAVAQRQLEWLHKFYHQRTGRAADDFDLYVMWNAGADYYRRLGFARDKVHRKIRHRAQRFVNLRHIKVQSGELRVQNSPISTLHSPLSTLHSAQLPAPQAVLKTP